METPTIQYRIKFTSNDTGQSMIMPGNGYFLLDVAKAAASQMTHNAAEQGLHGTYEVVPYILAPRTGTRNGITSAVRKLIKSFRNMGFQNVTIKTLT